MMKGRNALVVLLSAALALQGCGMQAVQGSPSSSSSVDVGANATFDSLADPNLTAYIEDAVYSELVDKLGEGDCFVENVEATYVSNDYLEELSYNSQENLYFGYSLADLEAQFGSEKYLFTIGDDGQTTAKVFEAYDDTFDTVIRNVAIGSGVILLCATVSVVTAGAGAPAAISAVFAFSAKTGTAVALSSGAISGAAAGIVTGVQTGDMDQALRDAAVSGSDGFMWGAIGGAVTGGVTEGTGLFGAARNGLTMSEAAHIQRESKYPLDVIKSFKSVDEYQKVYKGAGLRVRMVGNKTALVRDIDLDCKSTLGGKEVTNLERMKNGAAPIDPATGESYQLHHVNQDADGTLAILTQSEHLGNSKILHRPGMKKDISDTDFARERSAFWKAFAEQVEGRG